MLSIRGNKILLAQANPAIRKGLEDFRVPEDLSPDGKEVPAIKHYHDHYLKKPYILYLDSDHASF
jgi:hypothetical protein